MSEISRADIRRSRRSLILLIILFLSPVIAAWLVYSHYSQSGNEKTKNYGELVSPARPLSNFALVGPESKPFTIKELRGKWSMVYFDDGECKGTCEQDLYMAHQARLSLNEDVKRVARFLILAKAPSARLEIILTHHPDLVVVKGNGAAIMSIQRQFEIGATKPVISAQRLYLVDPLGNLMMTYPSGFNAKGLIRDMQHLLKWSQIG